MTWGYDIKRCCGCKIKKDINLFGNNRSRKDGKHHYCLSCAVLYSKKWRKKNTDKSRYSCEKYRQKNKNKISEYKKQQRITNVEARIANNIRSRLKIGLKSAQISKSNRYIDFLGCSYKELKFHIETQFDSTMSWYNYGEIWHIDHIIPISFCKKGDIDFMKTLLHYKNLRPLCKMENIKKSNTFDLTLAIKYCIVIPESYLTAGYDVPADRHSDWCELYKKEEPDDNSKRSPRRN